MGLHKSNISLRLNNPDSITAIIKSNGALELCIDSIFDNTELINSTNDMDITKQ